MTPAIKLIGWLDEAQPAILKEAGQHEFRIRLSEAPSSTYRKVFAELSKDEHPRASIEQAVMVLSCELTEIGSAMERIKQRIRRANEMVVRQEREADARVNHQMEEAEARRTKVLRAVKDICFDDS